ncbi:RNA 2'-phosphotransferase [Arthrobacter sp. YD2]|uniref:RNA 2'-phosphotransferase n=1 Tax=Arthrobacter sp. YD2 TaxID=3058046 RepID=UPI0025B2EBC8|nr:RNA 2'-phosphotransferase [Arthrobacter sp. YD2]MDN3904781.1 RNA 2'-phosphotransferase [Arthrobacter sp. YD2]
MTSTPSRSAISRVLSHALRHAPGEYGLVLDPEGWAPVPQVLAALHRLGPEWEAVDEEMLHGVLEAAGKKRHQISDGRIRAVHGHSVPVRPAEEPIEPPAVLFHGTARDTVPVIRVAGILPMGRRYVHLAETAEQAREVGQRKDSSPVILAIDTGLAVSRGVSFYRSESGVWLSGPIPAAAVNILDVSD